jgi:hypothetical protein
MRTVKAYREVITEIEAVTKGSLPETMKVDVIRDLCATALIEDRGTPTEAPRDDPAAARHHATTHARQPKDVPHHLRCDFMRSGDRCLRGSGHAEKHLFPDGSQL